MIYKAIANGDFSTLAIWQTWNGTDWINATVLPGLGDDVYSNNFIVTITSDVFVNSLNRSSLSSPVITQGGQFQITGANEITLSGQVNGGNEVLATNNPLSACVNRLATHINKFHRIGDDVGGSNTYSFAFCNGSTYNIDIIGNQSGGSGRYAYGFYNNTKCTFESIIGNQSAGSGHHSVGFYNTAASTFNSIIGNQSGGSGSDAYGFYNTAASTFFSDITGVQSGIPSFGFYNVGNLCEITFIGSEAYPQGISNISATAVINFRGNSYNNLQTGVMAIRSNGNVNFDLYEFRIGLTSTLNEIVLYPANVLENQPTESDVRDGVIYGIANNYQGTLKVANPATVLKGVPTDDTVGEWEFDDDLIERLKHCATTEIVDVQLASYQNT